MRVLVISPDRNHSLELPEKPIFPLLGPLAVAGLFDRDRHDDRFIDETIEAIDSESTSSAACPKPNAAARTTATSAR